MHVNAVQVSTYKYIEEASESLTADGGDLHGSLNVSEVLFGSSHGHIHFVNSHLLVPLEVTPRFPHSTQHAQHRARTAPCKMKATRLTGPAYDLGLFRAVLRAKPCCAAC